MVKQTVPFGLWPSPITPVSLSQGLRLNDLAWDTDGRALIWLEGRSDRGVLVCSGVDHNAPRDLTTDLSVRARVGYGGGDLGVSHGHAYFVSGGRVYRQPLQAGGARPITPLFGSGQADGPANPTLSPDGAWVLYVHSYEGHDGLAIVDSEGSLWPQKLAQGEDFYMQPAWHPDGQKIAWISWDHPQMPWDGCRLNLAALELGPRAAPAIGAHHVIAGDEDTAIFQPAFSPDGRYLAYISDASGWSNLYLYDLQQQTHIPLVTGEVELAAMAWTQGSRTYGWSPDGSRIYYCRNERAAVHAWFVDVASGTSQPVVGLSEYSDLTQIAVSSQGWIAALASSWSMPPRVVVCDPLSEHLRIMARSDSESVSQGVFSEPQAIIWESMDDEEVHGLYYAPRQGAYDSPGKPPLIVLVHGGPTGQSVMGFSVRAQFLTSRGYAVLDVNYRGSSGYGRAYRNALRGQWGIYDVDDAISGARHLANQGLVAEDKMVIMGGSAGGYTVLQALIRYPGIFRAGVCLYGVTNLFTLASDTHKFEQHYLDQLVGPLPQTGQYYRERSPVFAADRIRDAIIIFQGDEDRVVPRDQAETLVDVLKRNGIPYEYHLYPGEGHGWRKSETVKAFYETLLRFLKQNVIFA